MICTNKVLIIDDEPDMGKLLSMALSPLDYDLTITYDGLKGLDHLENELFNVVILDIMLPGPNGIEVLKRIRERWSDIEVIMLTAHESLETALQSLRLGAYDYITKPFSNAEVRSTVKQAMDKHHLGVKLDAIYDLSRELALSLNVDQVIETALDVASRMLGFKRGCVWLKDEEAGILRRSAACERDESQKAGDDVSNEVDSLSLEDDEGIILDVVRSGELDYTPDTREEPASRVLGTEGVSLLAVPLEVRDRVIGVLTVASDKVDAFDAGEEKLASALAAQVAVSIENARLHEQAQQEIAERERVQAALEKSEEKFRSVIDQAGEGITLVNEEGHVIEWNRRQEQLTGLKRDEAVGEPMWKVMPEVMPEEKKTSEMQHLIRQDLDSLLERGKDLWPGRSVEVAYQLPDGADIVAQHYIFPVQVGRETLLANFSRDITERKRVEEEIQQRNNELTSLNEIHQAVNTTLDLQETLTIITEHCRDLLDVEATSVLLHDEKKDELEFAAASGLASDVVLGCRFDVGHGIAGWVAEHGESVLVSDVSNDSRWYRGIDARSDFKTRSLLCVPLRSREQILGVLEAVNKKVDSFDQDDLRLLGLLAEPAAMAIENARLFEKVRVGREQLRALSHRLVDVQEAERGRVARELHDETGQALSSLLLGLSLLEGEVDEPVKAMVRINELEGLVDRTLDNLHRLAIDLRPASLDHLGLIPALEHYIEVFDDQNDLVVNFEVVGIKKDRLTPASETALYRIVQEAMTNVLRHAEAGRVDVLLERRGDQVVVVIEDDGVGFDLDAALQSGRLGLLGMRERAEMLGGSLVIESDAGEGTTIVVEVPVHAKGEEAQE